MSDQPVFTLQQVARYLNVHRNTIYRLAQRGHIPAFKVGSDWRFNRESIDAWRLAQERPVASSISNSAIRNPQLRTELLEIVEWYFEEALQKSVSLGDLCLFSESDESAVCVELCRMIEDGFLETAGAKKETQYRPTLMGLSHLRSTSEKAKWDQAGHASFIRKKFSRNAETGR